MNTVELNHIDLNSIGLNSKVIDGVGKSHGGKIKPYIAGHVTDSSSSFTFKVNNAGVTVPVDANGNWKWVVDREVKNPRFSATNISDIVLCNVTVTGGGGIFASSTSDTALKSIFLKDCDLSALISMGNLANNRQGLKIISGLDKKPIINATSLNVAFQYCYEMELPEGFKWENFATSSLKDLTGAFMNCRKIKKIDLRNVTQTTKLHYTFYSNNELEELYLPYCNNDIPSVAGWTFQKLTTVNCDFIALSLDFGTAPLLTEQSVVNLFNAVAADDITLTFHQNVWNMIMREIDVQDSPIQVAYQNMIDNYDVTIANASFDAEIEYLGMSGTQYVDSNFKANTTTTKAETKIQIDGMSTNIGLFGSRNTAGATNSASCNAMIMTVGQKIRFDWVNGDANVSSGSLSMATDYSITTTRGLAIINGTEFIGTNTDSVNQTYNFLIGNFSNGSSPFTTGFNGKFYWFKIYNNNQLVRDFIPVRKGTTGYLYDKISGNLFGNSGTGDFILGNDK